MIRFSLVFAGLLPAAVLCPAAGGNAPQPECSDVVVYGGTSAGVIAAVEVARLGKSVILIEDDRHVGGLTSGGLSMTDTGEKGTIGGLAGEFYRRIYQHYLQPSAWKFTRRDDYLNRMPAHWGDQINQADDTKMQFVFEPHVAENVFNQMLREAGVKVVLGERLDLKAGVGKSGRRITGIRMESGRRFEAVMFIDATHEGDLMAKAGVPYTTGRESNIQYGEMLNGILPTGANAFPLVDPFVIKGDPSSGLLPRIEPKPPGKPGEGDQRNQAYNFRLCLTRVPENRMPFIKPAGYNPMEYEILARWLATMKELRPEQTHYAEVALGGKGRNIGFTFHAMPNRKTDSNTGWEFASDYIGRSYDWADADYEKRAALWAEHKTYVQGLLWFLAHDERCPEPIRREMRQWGLAKDEFTDTENWPFQLYVREARRMVGDYVMTEHDARGTKKAEDVVALASYPSDSHGVSYYIDEKNRLWREKGFFVRTGVFPISYRAICPPRGSCENLLVPVCASSSHAAYGPLRMEPVFMMLGHAAAAAACLAIDTQSPVQKLSYVQLRRVLERDGQILDWD